MTKEKTLDLRILTAFKNVGYLLFMTTTKMRAFYVYFFETIFAHPRKKGKRHPE